MAKTIKFNLILDGDPVRNIEGLREHFSIEDMLKYFENGLLLRWLNVRGYEKQYNEVEAIDKSLDKTKIVTSLVKIFEVTEMKDADIEKEIRILKYLDEENKRNAIYKKNAFSKKQIIDEYHSEYNALVRHMEENADNMSILKADAIQMEREYLGLFKIDYYTLFFRLMKTAPKAIFAILTIDALREFWTYSRSNYEYNEDEYDEDDNEDEYDEDDYFGKYSIDREINDLLSEIDKVKEILGDDLKVVQKNTQAMWDPIEKPEVKLMVISINEGSFIKNAGNFSEKLGAADVNYKLIKFNGLEYQCNNEDYELLYMEV